MSLEQVEKLTKDMRAATVTLSVQEVRYLVDSYYQMQDNRKRSDNQIRAMLENSEPHEVLSWLTKNNRLLENQIKASLDAYSGSQPIGQWARSVSGIGPVIAAGLLAHIDINKAPTVGHIWRFAGIGPDESMEKR